MLHATMRRDAVGAATGYFYPKLLECEDMDRFEELVASGGRSILAEAMTRSLEAFDAKLREVTCVKISDTETRDSMLPSQLLCP